MKKYFLQILSILLIFYSMNANAQKNYWVGFTDKNNTLYSLSTPGDYLSERAIQRRVKQNIAIDSLDLPVNQDYISEVLKLGAKHLHSSKWLNGITVKAETDSFEIMASKLSFVKEVQLTKTSVVKSGFQKLSETSGTDNIPIDASLYGASVYQTSTLNGQFLHNQNYRGQGIQIAVLDGGFYKANEYFALDSLWANGQILGTKDFVDTTVDIFTTHWHGMSVLSCIGGNVPGQLIGTAPKASFWLIRSEDTGSEFLIEEDNWVAAAEFADSVGIDIINSSLGYTQFDDPQTNHVYADMNGNTTRITKGANIAASRGMLVFSSAGNEGNNSWKYIVAPSDGENVIGVGAVNKDSVAASFTSYGPAYGGKIKPNVSAVGWNTYLQKSDGSLGYLNGTSFSSPVMAGMAACLWGSVKHVSAKELKQVLEQHSHLFANPNSLLGYGIPNFELAWEHFFPMKVEDFHNIVHWEIYPNPVKDNLFLYKKNGQSIGKVEIEIFSLEGRLLKKWIKADTQRIELYDIQSLPNGILLLKISSAKNTETFKLSKFR